VTILYIFNHQNQLCDVWIYILLNGGSKMNVFLVGNGYDLHHKFPTGYINFLNTIKFLTEKYDESFDTVGKVFGNSDLQETDAFIKECYKQHCKIYDNTSLPKKNVEKMIAQVKDNMWFKYLCNSVAKDINWIDFEKEIIRVLEAFNHFFEYDDSFRFLKDRVIFDFSKFPNDIEDRCILLHFDYFFRECEESWVGLSHMMYILPRYSLERIKGSNFYHILEDDIVSDLYIALREFTNVLRDYLLYFVDAPSQKYTDLGVKTIFESIPTPNRVFSFNYTNTFEIIYNNNMIDHIHGNTNTDIVLGINPDENDSMGNIDTRLIQFKKYFQRVFYKTDIDFLKKINDFRMSRRIEDINLFVIGHSLDSTDEDIIRQIFDLAKSIIILYHNETSVKNHIKNLVQMYGKEGLDMLREEKNLCFLPQGEIHWES